MQTGGAVEDAAAVGARSGVVRHGRVVEGQLTFVEHAAYPRTGVVLHGRSVQGQVTAVPETTSEGVDASAVLDGQIVQDHGASHDVERRRDATTVENRGAGQRQVLVDV